MKLRAQVWPECPTCRKPVALQQSANGKASALVTPLDHVQLSRFDWICAYCSTVVHRAAP